MEQYERFDQIYSETRDDLLRYLMLRTNAAPEAEDLFQEVYRRFYTRLTRSVLPILDPRRYLFSVAKKVLAGYYRSAAKRKAAPTSDCAASIRISQNKESNIDYRRESSCKTFRK